MFIFRFSYPTEQEGGELQVTKWDALGYYMYNPSIFIYNDVTELKWVNEIDSTYQLSGGEFYQANKTDNGNYVNKYLGGVAIMQLPFFAIGHAFASMSAYPADGFSAPYQYSIAFAAIFYALLGLLILRNVLRRYFDDWIVAVSLLFMALATNLVQYTAVEGGQSHAYIFPLYAIVLWLTIKWHEQPARKWALLIGLTIGLATICRPTELIMLFIPLAWNLQNKEAKRSKWQLVKAHKMQVLWAVAGGLIGILPQLLYWKYTSGSFIYNVGSKWFFFNPWFRVLFGVDNGFFIYTPITIFFILGFFMMRRYPFQRAVLTFCLLNIWIIMAWSDWRYGATFSTRAMVQSYPVFTLAFASLVAWTWHSRVYRSVLLGLGAFLIYANIFQMIQYNALIINYRDMSWAYYGRIYLNPHPTPLDMSLLDHNDFIHDETDYVRMNQRTFDGPAVDYSSGNRGLLAEVELDDTKNLWVKVEARIRTKTGFNSCVLEAGVGQEVLGKVRLHNPLSVEHEWNNYAFYVRVPDNRSSNHFEVSISGLEKFEGEVGYVKLTYFRERL